MRVTPSGPWFNIKMSSYQYRKSHCGDKTVVRSSYLHKGICYIGKMTSLYWIRSLIHPFRRKHFCVSDLYGFQLFSPRQILAFTNRSYLCHLFSVRQGKRYFWEWFRFYNKIRSRSFHCQWRHNEYDGISNHQPNDCLLNRLSKRRSKKTSKLRVTGLCHWPVTGEFPAQRTSNAKNVFIWWRHHGSVRRRLYFSHWNSFCYPSIFACWNGLVIKMNQILESQQTPHISPSRANCGVSIVSILDSIDRVTTARHFN